MFQILIFLTAVGLVLYSLTSLVPQANSSSTPIQPTSTAVATHDQEPSLTGKAGDAVVDAMARVKSLVEQKENTQSGSANKADVNTVADTAAPLSTKTTAHAGITRQGGDVPEPPLEEVYFGATAAKNETTQSFDTPLLSEHTDQHSIAEVIQVSRDNAEVFTRIERLTREH